MTRTAHASEKMKRDCLIATAARQGTPILCAICGQPIRPGQPYAFDHGHAIGRDGANTVENLFPVHDAKVGEFNCHTRKTAHPRGPHTAIGGDTFEAAKTKRLAASAAINKRAPGEERQQGAIRSRTTFPQRLHAWPPRGSRPMNRKRRA